MKYVKIIITLSAVTLLYSGCSGGGKGTGLSDEPSPVLSSDTSIELSIGTLDGTVISGVPYGTSLESFLEGVTVDENARAVLYEEDGETTAADLKDGYRMVVTAEDGTTAVYYIDVDADPRLVASWSEFDPESEDYTIVGAQVVEGVTEGSTALQFDFDVATMEYVLVPDSDALTLRDKGTVEVWIKAESIVPYAGIVHKGESKTFTDEAYGLQLYYYAGSQARLLFFITGDDGSWIGIHGSFDIIPGNWYHVVGTWNESTLVLYVNSVSDGSVANTTGGVRDTDGGLVIGAQLTEIYSGTYGNLGWDGLITGVTIMNDYMEGDEVLARYNAVTNQ